MCMCYEGECRHKPKPIKIAKKPITEPLAPEPKSPQINHSLYFKVSYRQSKYFLRQKDNHLLFYSARADMPFTTLNLAQDLILSAAKHIIEKFYPNCEAVTLSTIQKELKI